MVGDSTEATPVLNMSVDHADTNLPAVASPTAGIATHSYRVRTVTGTGAAEKMSEWSTPGSVSINAAQLINTTARGDSCPANLDDVAADDAAIKDLKVDCRAQAGLVQSAGGQRKHVGPTGTVDELSAARDGKGNVEITISRHTPKAATSFRIDVANVRDQQRYSRFRPLEAGIGFHRQLGHRGRVRL